MADALIDIGQFAELFDERYHTIVEQQLAIANENDIIPRLYNVMTSDRQSERRADVGEYPEWNEFGSMLEYQRRHMQYNTIGTPRTYATGQRITLTALEDQLEEVFDGKDFEAMVRAGHHTRQRHANRLLNYATVNDTHFYVRSEGVALASTSHTTRTPGVSTASGFDNLLLSPLSKTSYRAALIQMMGFVNDVGQEAEIVGDELWVQYSRQPDAEEILGTDRGLHTAEHTINPEYRSAKLCVSRLWRNPDDWAVMNSNLRMANCDWIERVPMAFRTIGDHDTFQIKSSGRGRWGIRIADWRFIVYSSVN